MERKAKRENKALDFYLKAGMAPPTMHELATLKKLSSHEEMFQEWKKVERFRQHCFAFHLKSDNCARGRGCSFLHMDPKAGSDQMEGSAYG